MSTQLSDLEIVPEVFSQSMIQQSLALDLMIESGIAFVDPEIDGFLNGPTGGKTFSKRYLNPLDEDESNLSSDDSTEASAAATLSGGAETLIRHSRNKSWSSMDLTAAMYGSDPLGSVQSQIAKYWMTQRQKILMKSLIGIIADNVANDSSDMIEDITGTGDGTFTGTGFINAALTLGDRMGEIQAVGIHSMVMGTLLENDQIVYIPDSEGKATIPTYKGRRVIMDDGMPVDVTDPQNPVYTSVLFGNGAIAIGNGAPMNPIEVDRNPSAGNGGGEELLFSRVELACHPLGFAYLGAIGATGKSPTWAQLATAGSWNRVYSDRKRIPLAFIKSLA